MTESKQAKSDSVFEFEGNFYEFNLLDEESKKLVNGLRVADKQIRRYKNTLQLLEVGRKAMADQLQGRLDRAKPLQGN